MTERLAPLIPNGKIIVSESGITGPEDLSRITAAGANSVLIGETLVTADDPGLMLRKLV